MGEQVDICGLPHSRNEHWPREPEGHWHLRAPSGRHLDCGFGTFGAESSL